MAFQPRAGHTDANRNLISNIHVRGLPTEHAATRIVNLAAQMMELQSSGIGIKEIMQHLTPDIHRLDADDQKQNG